MADHNWHILYTRYLMRRIELLDHKNDTETEREHSFLVVAWQSDVAEKRVREERAVSESLEAELAAIFAAERQPKSRKRARAAHA